MTQTLEQKAARRAVKGVGPDTDIAGNPLTDEQKATRREIEARWAREDAMTANRFTALLRDVPRYRRDMIGGMERDENGPYVFRDEVLARISAMEAERDELAERNKENSRLAEDNARGLREAETALAAERAKVAKLVEALTFYSCEDGCNDCSENERDLIGCGWTARAAITEAGK